jgi:acetylornithine deacetylase/succinyl-diaminopimelate desuccinylase-like protein
MVKNNTPSICCGYRGIVSAEIELTTFKQNLHSGSFGGGALNAAECLAKLLSKIKDENNKIKIKGFYDNVREEVIGTAGVWYKIKDFLKLIGARKISCEKDYDLNHCLCLRPTFEINGMHSGSSEDFFQYIVPSTAKAKVSFRLVCNQDPKVIFARFKDFINKNKQNGTKVDIRLVDKAYPTIISQDTDFIRKIEKSFDNLFKNDIVKYYEGGCVPIVYDFLKFTDQIYMVGFGSPDDNIHGPNEKLNVKDFFKGIRFYKNLIKELEK